MMIFLLAHEASKIRVATETTICTSLVDIYKHFGEMLVNIYHTT